MAKNYNEWVRIRDLCQKRGISFSEAGKRGATVRAANVAKENKEKEKTKQKEFAFVASLA